MRLSLKQETAVYEFVAYKWPSFWHYNPMVFHQTLALAS